MADTKQEMLASPVPTVVIRPSRGWIPINLKDLWAYRELLYFLTWREIKVRYKQTLLGFAWAIIQPLFMMIVFTLFFGNLAKIPSEGIPYPLFNYAALLAFIILIVMMFYYGYVPTVNIFWLPAFILLAVITALGVGLWLSAINVKYRDVRYVIPFLTQLWLFASPVVYSSSLLPERFQAIYGINPMAGVIEGFRWALLGTNPPGSLIAVSALIALVILVSGAYYFRRNEKTFADVI